MALIVDVEIIPFNAKLPEISAKKAATKPPMTKG